MEGREGAWSPRVLATALLRAQGRYWFTVAPRVRHELKRWREHAAAIDDPVLRACAAEKLEGERANTEGIATLYTLAPLEYRRPAVDAAVALQVMYDYLDAVHEQPMEDPLASGRHLFRAVVVGMTPGEAPEEYYLHCPYRDGSGYLDALAERLSAAIAELPAGEGVLPTARRTCLRFGEAQTRSHAVTVDGVGQLEEWASSQALAYDLRWWEWSGGAAASVLSVHALLAAAADPSTTPAQAQEIDHAYLLLSSLATMLDSVIDDTADAAQGQHRYVAYYATPEEAACRVSAIARDALAAARRLPHAAHHAMTVAGISAFYLSSPGARSGRSALVSWRVRRQLGPIVLPILLAFRLWRRLRRS